MNNPIKILLTTIFLLSFSSCEQPSASNSSESVSEEPEIIEKKDYLLAEEYTDLVPLSEVSTDASSIIYEPDIFGEFENVKYQQLYFDNQLKEYSAGTSVLNYDSKYMFYNDNTLRFINCSYGKITVSTEYNESTNVYSLEINLLVVYTIFYHLLLLLLSVVHNYMYINH